MTEWTSIQIRSMVVLFTGTMLAFPAMAQTTDKQHSEDRQHQQADQSDLQEKIRMMQAKIAKLEAALKQNHSAISGDSAAHDGHGQANTDQAGKTDKGQMQGKKKMGGMGKNEGSGSNSKAGKISGMDAGGKRGMGMKMGSEGMSGDSDQGQAMSRIGMEMKSRGMKMMGKMKSMGDMKMSSSLPGFPGASHIYHVGADGFFLDHSEHITLTTEQQSTLNELKEETMLQQADFDRQIEAAEQELWVLTSSGSPDAKKIEDEISAITNLQGQQRLAYIRAVGEAAQSLTEEQRNVLTGTVENENTEK